ncbi:MAG: nitrile hydratase subunit alpha [Azospirillum sp.]|jgi:nitrile hydratase|nr:nitrile hydratase subunit alpha [Azospirillum sp.]MCZ8124823.1 nitrile hydratase subunit alpha [Magnetospirillum sp.]
MSGAHHGDHVHTHDHAHDPLHAAEPRPEYARLERAVRELLIAKGVFTAEDIRKQIELMDSRSPAMGARIVARAWVDPDYKRRLLADAKAAAGELGVDTSNTATVVALENTPARHHMVVCTLCSCYPKAILGVPPAWYKSSAYRARAVKEPRKVLAEFGTVLPDDVEIRVVDSTADMRYLVVPMRPSGTEGWSEERLAGLVGRDSMIGTALAAAP